MNLRRAPVEAGPCVGGESSLGLAHERDQVRLYDVHAAVVVSPIA